MLCPKLSNSFGSWGAGQHLFVHLDVKKRFLREKIQIELTTVKTSDIKSCEYIFFQRLQCNSIRENTTDTIIRIRSTGNSNKEIESIFLRSRVRSLHILPEWYTIGGIENWGRVGTRVEAKNKNFMIKFGVRGEGGRC